MMITYNYCSNPHKTPINLAFSIIFLCDLDVIIWCFAIDIPKF